MAVERLVLGLALIAGCARAPLPPPSPPPPPPPPKVAYEPTLLEPWAAPDVVPVRAAEASIAREPEVQTPPTMPLPIRLRDVPVAGAVALQFVTAADDGAAWVLGFDGRIYRGRGGRLSPGEKPCREVPGFHANRLRVSATHLVVSGVQSQESWGDIPHQGLRFGIRPRRGGRWRCPDEPGPTPYDAKAALLPDGFLGVHNDGTAWSDHGPASVPPGLPAAVGLGSVELAFVEMVDRERGWAFGFDVWEKRGAGWEPRPPLPDIARAAWIDGRGDPWVALEGAIAHFEGGRWRVFRHELVGDDLLIAGAGADDIWVATQTYPLDGDVSQLLHFDGTTMRSTALPWSPRGMAWVPGQGLWLVGGDIGFEGERSTGRAAIVQREGAP